MAAPVRPARMAICPAKADAVHMRLPGPRFSRLVTLVAIDDAQRVALFPQPAPSPWRWALPQCTVQPLEPYSQAAVRLAVHCFGDRDMRWGSVVGRRWAPPPAGTFPARVEEHVFIARAGPSPPGGPAQAGRPDRIAVWTPRASLGPILREPHLDTTATLVDGYLDGWLPDGPITLE